MYETEVSKAEAKQAAAEQEAKNRAVYEEVLAKFPLEDCTANWNLLIAWSGDGILTEEKAAYLIKHRPQGFNLALTSRERLLAELADLLRSGCSTKTMSDYDFRQWKVKASLWSLRQIRAYRRELLLKQELDTAQKAKNYLTEVRNGEQQKTYVGFPRYPKVGVARGEVFSRPWDSAYLKSLDAYELRRLTQIYGSEQINDRLAGKS
jgi:hypothetical protein